MSPSYENELIRQIRYQRKVHAYCVTESHKLPKFARAWLKAASVSRDLVHIAVRSLRTHRAQSELCAH